MHIPVDSGHPRDRFRFVPCGKDPSLYALKAFMTVGQNLWPTIKRLNLGGETYARCILASCAIRDFFLSRKLPAEVVPAILDVSLRKDGVLAHRRVLGIGEPDAQAGTLGIHVVCKVTIDGGREWLVDGSTRQAARPGDWEDPPEVVAIETFAARPQVPPDDLYAAKGFHPLAATALPQSSGKALHLQWLGNQNHPDLWSSTPDADPEKSKRIVDRLNEAWKRTKIPR